MIDKSGSLWIATPGGLNRLGKDGIESYSQRDGLPSNDVTNLYLARDDTLFVQTQSPKIVRRVNDRFEPLLVPGVSVPTIALLQDRGGDVWIGSATQGLFRINGGQIDRFTTKDGLSSDVVSNLYEDRDGNIWVGTNEGGLDRFHDGSFTTYAREEGLATDQTYSVIEDHEGAIWATTIAGLDRIGPHGVQLFTTADGLPTNSAWSLWEDRQQQLWAGTSDGGLVRSAGVRFVKGCQARQIFRPTW